MQCPIDPEGTKCIVMPDEIDPKTPGGIWVPPSVKEQHQLAVTYGTLARIGPRAEICFNDNGDGKSERAAKIGDRVIFVKYAGTNIRWGDKIFQILQDQDIIGLMLEEPPVVDFALRRKYEGQPPEIKLNTDRIVIPGR